MLEVLYTWVKANIKKEEGQAMAEYGLILALIAVIVIGVVGTIGLNLQGKFKTIGDALKP
jgi:pilus assembly protein Flp/PilA